MGTFQRVVCAVDFSQTSADALKYAAMFAACGGAELHVVHAILLEPPVYFTHSQLDELHKQHGRSLAAAERTLSEFTAETLRDSTPGPVVSMIVDGPAADAVVEYARSRHAGLIVMGTHGRSGFSRMLLGSVAEKLIRASPSPVLIVRAGRAASAIRHVLCPVNGTPMARRALQLAADIACCARAVLTVMHVVEETFASENLDDVRAWLNAGPPCGCEVRETRRTGNPAAEIIHGATAIGADLIVIGATHKPFADATVLGSTTVRVARHAHVPVLMAFETTELNT